MFYFQKKKVEDKKKRFGSALGTINAVARVYLDLVIQKSYAGCKSVRDDDVCNTS
jgi:hypothetical protein